MSHMGQSLHGEPTVAELVRYQMLIDGAWVDASDGQRFDSVNPHDGLAWATIPEATSDDVDRAVRAAHRAQSEGPWASLTPSQRGKYVSKLGTLLAENSEALGRVETRDTGKLYKETAWQAKYIAEYFHFFGGAADKVSGETLPIDKPDMFVFTDREPLGVIAAVIPWNSQMFLSATKIAPALAAGNSIVLKASEEASAPLLEFGKLVAQAGIPEGVINIVTGHGEPCGRALTSHPLVAKVAFTGGPNAARHVIGNSAHNFAQVSLELGGKSPFIVFDDANLESAVNGSVAGIFGASGQSCVAGSRLYLHEDIADAFLDKMIAVAQGITIGDPMADDTEMGPLCTTAQIQHIKAQIAQAKTEGCTLLTGGDAVAGLGGQYFQPTIIEAPRQDASIVDTELFGPVLTVQRFKDEAQALALANDTKHGLAAGIFTRDSARSLRMARSVRAGIVWVNTYRAISPIAAFGGERHSGYGREAGLQAMADYTRPKTVWMNMSDEPLSSPFQPR